MAYNLRPRPGIQVETLGPMSRETSTDRLARERETKGQRGPRVLATLLVFRWLNVAMVQTSFVPDEYWQSLEVAHNVVFGYGYMTWEWQSGLRGYTYPAMFAALYKLLAVLRLDFPLVLIFAPRVLQATLSALGDFCLYQTSCSLHGPTVGKWTLIMNSCSWFVFYNATRTLTNTMETTLTAAGLCLFPWPKDWLHDKSARRSRRPRLYILIVALACLVRPTAAVLWLPLCLWHINLSRSTSLEQLRYIRFLPLSLFIVIIDALKSALVLFLPVGILALGLSLVIDRLFYGQFVFVQKNFVEFNFIHDFGAFYGTHPWHWYFSQGFPVIMATHIPIFLLGAKMGYRKNGLLLFVIFWTLCIYSFTSHKEFRFIYPVVPVCMLFCGLFMGQLQRASKCRLLVLCLLLLNAPAAIYFGLVHQRGVLDAMGAVRRLAAQHEGGLHRSVLFLMPCHSTPFYSHVHQELPMRFLECPPPLSGGDPVPSEDAVFYHDPIKWLEMEFPDTASTPTHLIFFDVLKLEIKEFLDKHVFEEVASYFHTHLPEGRMGSHVLVYGRQPQDTLPER